LALTIQAVVGLAYYNARRFEEALELHQATLALDPGNLRALIWSVRNYRVTGRPEQGLPMIQDAIARVGRLPICLGELGCLLARLGRPQEAREVLYELIELEQQRYVSAVHEAAIYQALGEEAELKRCFDRLVANRSGMLVFLSDPTWDEVRDKDWCRALLARAGLS
jgi:tetratricopeptide (TPR) repeat protein